MHWRTISSTDRASWSSSLKAPFTMKTYGLSSPKDHEQIKDRNCITDFCLLVNTYNTTCTGQDPHNIFCQHEEWVDRWTNTKQGATEKESTDSTLGIRRDFIQTWTGVQTQWTNKTQNRMASSVLYWDPPSLCIFILTKIDLGQNF